MEDCVGERTDGFLGDGGVKVGVVVFDGTETLRVDVFKITGRMRLWRRAEAVALVGGVAVGVEPCFSLIGLLGDVSRGRLSGGGSRLVAPSSRRGLLR